jgi:hypothetical protein
MDVLVKEKKFAPFQIQRKSFGARLRKNKFFLLDIFRRLRKKFFKQIWISGHDPPPRAAAPLRPFRLRRALRHPSPGGYGLEP